MTSSLTVTRRTHTLNSRDRMRAVLGWLDLGWGPLVCALKHSMPRDGHTTSPSLLERSDSPVGLGQALWRLPECPGANLSPEPRYRGGQSQGPCLTLPALPLAPAHTPYCSCAGLPGPLHPFNRHSMALAVCQALRRHRRQGRHGFLPCGASSEVGRERHRDA